MIETRIDHIDKQVDPLKVLHLVSGIDPEAGGVSQALRTLITGMSEFNIESDVACLDDPGADFLNKDSFEVFALGPGKTSWVYNRKLAQWLNSNAERYKVIIVHGLWQYHTLAIQGIFKDKKPTSPKVFVMPHGMLDPWFQRAKERRFKAIRNWFIWHITEKNIVNKSNGLLFTCETEKVLARETFGDYTPKKEVVVGLGTNAPPAFNESMSLAFQTKMGLKTIGDYILFLGRIDIKKGVDLLINAYISIRKKEIDLPKLVIAGPGMDTPFGMRMLELAKNDDNIIFPGMLVNDAKWGAFYGCQAFILPSHQENFGIAVAEALACGKPVLISNQVNIWREIQTEEAGIVGYDTELGVVDMINTWMKTTPIERIKMGEKAIYTFKKHFTIKQAAFRMSEALR